MKKTVSPKSSGGGGDVFENEVCAWWVLHLLAGRSPIDLELGAPQRIRFQAKVDGWQLDDCVAEFAPRGGPVRAAISVKSGPQIKGDRMPLDFVLSCWELHLKGSAVAFDTARDRLVLATQPLPVATATAITRTIERATKQDPELFEERINQKGWANERMRVFVDSFRCPDGMSSSHPVHGRLVGALLRSIRLNEFDFGRVDSRSEEQALRICREIVLSGTEADAQNLWAQLSRIVNDLRPESGTLTLPSLLDKLRGVVPLKYHPDYTADWDRLDHLSRSWSGETRNLIGTSLHLNREGLHQRVADAIENNRTVVILGHSGSGKSALIRDLALPSRFPNACFLLRADEAAGLESQTQAPRRALSDFLATQPAKKALLVLDGVDRLSSEQQMLSLARVIRALGLDRTSSPWRLLISCQSVEWNRALIELRKFGADLRPLEQVVVANIEPDETREVGREYPWLAPLLSRPELLSVTANAKVLDLLATAGLENGPRSPQDWIGESSLIAWFWDRFLLGGGRDERHGTALQHLARDQADFRTFATPFADLPNYEIEPVRDLAKLGVLNKRDETVLISHDLFGDYARQRYLRGQLGGGKIEELRHRLSNSLWHRAFRLLGLGLLESEGDSGFENWRSLLGRLGNGDPPSGVGPDLLLESIAFSARPGEILDRVLPELLANDKKLLKRFLRVFFYSTTVPHPGISAIETDSPSLRAEMESKYRVPDLQLWLPIMRWIAKHGDDVLQSSPLAFLDIAEAWLSVGRVLPDLPLLNEIGSLVLTLAEEAASGPFHRHPSVLRRYEVALLCTRHKERLSCFALELAGRRPKKQPSISSGRPAETDQPTWADRDLMERPDPWPDGPLFRPDDNFQDAALSIVGAARLVEFDPKVAEEVFLGLLIEPPKPKSRLGYGGWRDHECELHHAKAAYPPFHYFGPARQLLSLAPEVGIGFIVRLIDFATDRWAENMQRFNEDTDNSGERMQIPEVTLTIEGTLQSFRGNRNVFEWHTGGTAGPNVAVAALMALEKWLYEQLDEKKLNESVLSMMLRSSRSVAILGVLFELALRDPGLLLGPLEPLTESAELHFWGRLRAGSGHVQTAMIAWGMQAVGSQKVAWEWFNLPHRKNDFQMVVAHLFAKRRLKWPFVEIARQNWIQQREVLLASNRSTSWLDGLIAWFDQKNWEEIPMADGNQGLRYVHPQELVRRSEEFQRQSEERAGRLLFPFRCKRILDGAETISEDGLIDLLESAARYSEGNDEEQWFPEPTLAVRCGAAAVAINRFWDWLGQQPEWKSRCREWLLEGYAAEPPESSPDSRREIGGLFWDSFGAAAVPRLWIEAPDDTELRRLIANSVGAPHDDSVGRLFTEAALYRRLRPLDFSGLLHLAVLFARLTVLDHLRFWPAQTNIDVRAAFAEKVEDFVNGRLAPLPSDWPEMAFSWPDGFTRPENRIWEKRVEGFSGSYLVRAFGWVGVEAAEGRPTERKLLADLLEGLSLTVINRLQREVADSQDRQARNVDGVPYESDTEIARLCARLVVHEPNPDSRRRLWKPWVEIAPIAPAWAEDFLDAVYSEGLEGPQPALHFLSAIEEIFDSAFAAGDWLMDDSGGFRLGGVARALLGHARFAAPESRWSTERQETAYSLRLWWKRWAEAFLRRRGCTEALLALLATPAAKGFRLQALSWVIGALELLEEQRIQSALVSLLELVHGEASGNLAADPDAARAFETLLNGLVDVQNPRAVLLAKRAFKSQTI